MSKIDNILVRIYEPQLMAIALLLVGLFYLVPLFKLLHLFIRKILFLSPYSYYVPTAKDQKKSNGFLKRVFFFIAQIEYTIHPLRFYLIGLPVLVGFIYYAAISLSPGQDIRVLLLLLVYSFIVLWSFQSKIATDLKAAELMRIYPQAHPEVFYTRYKIDLAFGGIDFFASQGMHDTVAGKLDFRRNKRPSQSILTFVKVVIDTNYMAHICLSALKKVGPQYVSDIFDNAGSMWGKRILQLVQGQLIIKGTEKLRGKNGKFILIFNHKSSLDFVLTFFALSQIRVNDRFLRPRFIIAQDHFKDNKLIYNLLAVGRVCEAVNMVFISRKNRKESFENLKQAAKTIIQKDIDVAIYPQGTRAKGNYDRALKRRDSGYYTTIRQRDLSSELAHIKKGTGYLVWESLLALNQSEKPEDLNLVFIGIRGAGITLPKGSLKVQTESEIEFTVGHVETISPSFIEELQQNMNEEELEQYRKKFLQEINHLIHNHLKEVLGHNQMLTQRYLTELKGQFRYDVDKISAIETTIVENGHHDDQVFQILDCVYSLPIPQWNGYLSQLSQLLLEKTDTSRLNILLEEVAEELIKSK